MFEYNITYYHIEYHIEEREIPLSGHYLPIDPNPESFSENPIVLFMLNDMGNQGWELVNVSPVLRGCFNESASYGYSITAGYFFFWKRPKSNK